MGGGWSHCRGQRVCEAGPAAQCLVPSIFPSGSCTLWLLYWVWRQHGLRITSVFGDAWEIAISRDLARVEAWTHQDKRQDVPSRPWERPDSLLGAWGGTGHTGGSGALRGPRFGPQAASSLVIWGRGTQSRSRAEGRAVGIAAWLVCGSIYRLAGPRRVCGCGFVHVGRAPRGPSPVRLGVARVASLTRHC